MEGFRVLGLGVWVSSVVIHRLSRELLPEEGLRVSGALAGSSVRAEQGQGVLASSGILMINPSSKSVRDSLAAALRQRGGRHAVGSLDVSRCNHTIYDYTQAMREGKMIRLSMFGLRVVVFMEVHFAECGLSPIFTSTHRSVE